MDHRLPEDPDQIPRRIANPRLAPAHCAPRRVALCTPIALFLIYCVVIGSVAAPAFSLAAEHGTPEFRIGKNGRRILLPVTLFAREILALVDTGACGTAFDTSLQPLLGDYLGRKSIQTPVGERSVDTFDWPDVRLGGEILKSARPVICVDLDPARKASGAEIYAILGMDVLGTRRVQVDFDRGTLQLLGALPQDRGGLGERVPLAMSEDGTPRLAGTLADGRETLFLIDTGSQGNSIAPDLFDELVAHRRIRVTGASMSVTVTGAVAAEAGWLDQLSVGPFRHENLRVARINVSSVGLRYLSRFHVTFDFPGRAMYVRTGENHSRPEPTATSGLSLAWLDGEIVVQGVLKEGPADRAGIRPDDILLRIDGIDAGQFDHHSLRDLLTSEIGRSIPLTVRRRMRQFDVTIVLAEK